METYFSVVHSYQTQIEQDFVTNDRVSGLQLFRVLVTSWSWKLLMRMARNRLSRIL